MIRARIGGMILDESKQTPVLLLHLVSLDRFLPIWIGPPEAASIGMVLQNQTFERPLTHDLLVTVIDALEGKVARVVVVDQRDSTYFAKIFIERGDRVLGIDARPSDSIAIALRADAPIYVTEQLVEKVRDSLLQFDAEATDRMQGLQDTGPGGGETPGETDAGTPPDDLDDLDSLDDLDDLDDLDSLDDVDDTDDLDDTDDTDTGPDRDDEPR
jgi:bifunctional DNase/RNase